MLKLIQVEFLKLRRRKFIWLMLLAALFMPLAAVFYFSSVKGTGVDPIMFYKSRKQGTASLPARLKQPCPVNCPAKSSLPLCVPM